MRHWLLGIVGVFAIACGSPDARPKPGDPDVVPPQNGSAQPSASLPVEDFAACSADAECTFVSLGCCSTIPVNRRHVDAASRALEKSGQPYCAVKAACGPGADGTWAGTPGVCVNDRCASP